MARDVEADVVAGEQAGDDFLTPGDDVEDVARREVCVVKEGDLQVGAQLAQGGGHHPQVVVVQPHGGAVGRFGGGGFGKAAVDVFEDLPVVFREAGALPEGVDDRPEGFLGKTLVEEIHFGLAQRHARHDQIRIALGINGSVHLEFAAFFLVHAPGHPGAGMAAAEEAKQAGDDAVGRAVLGAHGAPIDHALLVR